MPTARACHNRRVARGIKLSIDLLCRRDKAFGFQILTFAILLVQFSREHCCFAFIAREQQAQGLFRCAQTPRSIQPRRKPETDILGQNWGSHAGGLH